MPATRFRMPSWKRNLQIGFVFCGTLSNSPPAVAQVFQPISVVLPMAPGEQERWAQPRPEPVTLDLPGWTMRSTPAGPSLPNQHIINFTRGTCDVQLVRFWDRALTDGGPMSLKGSRPVTVAGRQTELHKTSVFEGHTREVQVLWLEGTGYEVEYFARLRFERCLDDAVDEVLRKVEVHW